MDKEKQGRRQTNDDSPSSDTSLVMSLSLFIILLAFFIVMGSLSTYSPVKVGDVFDSIDLAFSKIVVPSEYHRQSMQEGENGLGKGDSAEELDAGLRSILPNLNIQENPRPDGGKTMYVRMKKNEFDAVSQRMIPLLVRIMNEKDTSFAHSLSVISYVQNPLTAPARQSFAVLDRNVKKIIERGLPKYKVMARIETGNPAYMAFQFDMIPKTKQLF